MWLADRPRTLFLDATHGTNRYRYGLFTLAMRDRFLVTLPVSWIITSSGAAAELQLAIEAVYRRIGMELRPNCYLIDEDTAEVRALCDAHGVRNSH
jgi:hypothetical protein